MTAPMPDLDAADARIARAARSQMANHQAAHAATEWDLTGQVTKTLSLSAPCPYCGETTDDIRQRIAFLLMAPGEVMELYGK